MLESQRCMHPPLFAHLPQTRTLWHMLLRRAQVLFWPWWRAHRADFRTLFYDYAEIPPEPLAVLQAYYDSRCVLGCEWV